MDAFVVVDNITIESSINRIYSDEADASWIACCIDTLKKWKEDDKIYEPVFILNERVYVLMIYQYVIFVGVCRREYPVFLLMEILSTMAETFAKRFDVPLHLLTCDLLNKNYLISTAMLDEMLDAGSPLNLEANAMDLLVPKEPGPVESAIKYVSGNRFLNEFNTSSKSNTLNNGNCDTLAWSNRTPGEGMGCGSGVGRGSGILGCGSSLWWRRSGVMYPTSEIIFTIIEKFQCVVRSKKITRVLGQCLSGSIVANCRVSGIPNLRVLLKNSGVSLDGYCFTFHPSVQISKWIDDQVIVFTPPDGPFNLCHYSLLQCTLCPPLKISEFLLSDDAIFVTDTSCSDDIRRFHFSVDIIEGFKYCLNGFGSNESPALKNVKLTMKLPLNIKTIVSVEVSAGKASFLPSTKELEWAFNRFPLTPSRNLPVTCNGVLSFSCSTTHISNTLLLKNFKPVIHLKFNLNCGLITNIDIDSVELGGSPIHAKTIEKILQGHVEYQF
jgi:hypothetical protein